MEESVKLTENEKAVMSVVSKLQIEEYGFSSIFTEDIAREMGVTINSVRGYVGSLVKKGLLWMEENESFEVVKVRGRIKMQSETQYFVHMSKEGYEYVGRGDEVEEDEYD